MPSAASSSNHRLGTAPAPASHHQVILLTMGQTAYFGPAVDSMAHFAKLGHTPEGLVNPAEYLLQV